MSEVLTDLESLVGAAIMSLPIDEYARTDGKREALKRYMRTYLRALPRPELESELLWFGKTTAFSDSVLYHLKKASDGYDLFMLRRRHREE